MVEDRTSFYYLAITSLWRIIFMIPLALKLNLIKKLLPKYLLQNLSKVIIKRKPIYIVDRLDWKDIELTRI